MVFHSKRKSWRERERKRERERERENERERERCGVVVKKVRVRMCDAIFLIIGLGNLKIPAFRFDASNQLSQLLGGGYI